MSDERSGLVLEVASEIAAGEPVSWEERTADLDDRETATVLERLRILEELGHAFRDAAPAQDTVPTEGVLFTWGHLRVLELLDEGSFGEVYRAADPVLDRQVALKLPKRSAGSPRRYVDEARRLARVRHRNVVTVFGAAVHDGRAGLWTDLVDGITLQRLVEDQGPLGAREAASIGIDLCHALAAVHDAGLVHGDVKPANVMRERGGRILLMDFGAGGAVVGGRGPRARAGTPVALAPEVLRGEPLTPASDLYSLGVVLYFLATGAWPVGGDTLAAIERAHAQGRRRLLRDRRSDLPAAFVDAVEQALEADPADRPATAGAMERVLRSVLARPETRPARVPRRWARWPLLFGAVVLGAIAVLWWLGDWSPEPAVADVEAAEFSIVSTSPGNHHSPSFSPDGELMAFVSDASGTDQIWVEPVGAGEPVQVTRGPEPADHPSWSVDGEIVFDRGQGIWAVPPLGGEPRRIAAFGYNPDVSPDGAHVVFEHERAVWLVPADGRTEPRRIEAIPSRLRTTVEATPAWSPDGRQLAWFHQDNGPLGDLWVVDLDTSERRQLTFDWVEAGDPAWSPDGRFLLFWSKRAGSQTLWRVPVAGGEPEPVTTGSGEDADPAFSPDGRTIVYRNTQQRWTLTYLDPASGEERSLLSRRTGIYHPTISPDGRRLAFTLHLDRGPRLFTMGLDGNGLRPVIEGDPSLHIGSYWSSDGAYLYFYRFPDPGETGVYRVPALGGPLELVVPEWTHQLQGDIVPSPDETRLAFIDQEAPPHRTKILDLETGEVTTVPGPHVHVVSWMPDGESLLGATHDEAIFRCPTDGTACTQLGHGLQPALGPGPDTITFLRTTSDEGLHELWRMDVDGSAPRQVGRIGPLHHLGGIYAVTPDGGVVYPKHQTGRDELWQIALGPESPR